MVAGVFLCAAINAGLNTNLNVSESLATVKASRLHDQDGSRIYNQAAILVCVIGFLAALSRPDSLRRALRVLWNPIVWVLIYLGIVGGHLWTEGNTWDLARLCGVWILMIVAMAGSAPMSLDRYVPKMVLLFRVLLWLSVVIALIRPDNGWQHQYDGTFIPGISERFVGVGGHPNGMGAIAGFAILLEIAAFFGGSANRLLGFLHVALASILLLLTQSKTSLVACVICTVFLLYSRKNRSLSGAVRVVAVTTCVVLGSLIAWSYLADWVASNEHNLGDLTGRLAVWQYLWNVGLEQPWFGYGRSLWAQLDISQSFQYKWAAGNAHNQLLNSFVIAGAVGVFCLVAYVAALFRQRRHIDSAYRSVFTACLLFLIVRAFAEAGLEPGNMTSVGHLQTVLIGFCLCRKTPRRIDFKGVPMTGALRRAAGPRNAAFAALNARMRRQLPVLPTRNPIAGRTA